MAKRRVERIIDQVEHKDTSIRVAVNQATLRSHHRKMFI